MPYSIKTKDGIIINNIPDAVPNTDQSLKDAVATLRSAGKTGSFDYTSIVAPRPTAAVPASTTTTTTVPPPAPVAETSTEADPKTSLLGMMGGAVRGAGPIAMGAAAGAALGAPIGGVGAIPGAIAGAGAAGLTQLVGDPIVGIINNLFGTKYTLPSDAMEDLFTRIGVAEPKTAAERVIQAAASGAAGGLSGVALGQAMQTGAGLGPSATKGIGEVLASGPTQQVTGGLGAGLASKAAAESGAAPAVQLGAGLAGSIVGGAIGGGVKLGPAPTGPVDEAAEAGVRLMTSDVKPPTSFAGKWLRSMGEKIPVTGTGPSRIAQQTERVTAVRDLIRQYGADDLAAASDDVMRDVIGKRAADLTKWTTAKNEVIEKLSIPLAGKVDDAISTVKALPPGALPLGDNLPTSQSGGPLTDMFRKPGTTFTKSAAMPTAAPNTITRESLVVPMTKTTQKIDDSIAFLKQLKTKQVQPVINILEDWKNAIQGQDLRNVEFLRKQIGDAFKAPELASVRSTGERVLSDIYGAVKDDMTTFIQKAGGTADFNKWQVANKQLAGMMKELDLPVLKSVIERGEATPEVISKMLFSTKRSDVEALYRNLSPDGRAAARTAVIAEAAKKAGDMFELNPDKFVTEIKRRGDQVGVLFSGDDLKQLQGLVRVVDATKRAAEVAKQPATGLAGLLTTVGLSAAALTSFFGKGVTGFLASMGIGASIGGAASLYESKPVRDLLMKIPSVKVGSAEEAALFKRLLETVQAVQNTTGNESRSTTPGGAR